MVRQIAEEIIASQTVEIAAMRGRMAVLWSGPNPEPGGIRRWGLCGVVVDCMGRGGAEVLPSAGRFPVARLGAGHGPGSFQASTKSVSGLQPR